MEKIDRVLKNLWAAPAWSKSLVAAQVLDTWEDIVGPQIASAVRPLGFARGVLTLEVSDNIWLQRLRFEEKRLLARLNERAGEAVFKKIRLVLKQNYFKKDKPKRRLQKVSPSKALITRLEKELALIEDEEIRKAFLKLRLTLLAKRHSHRAKRRFISSL
ncbi:protein of unknown function DUF721 [Thermodesulfatator indicus DSM 15286]|uniref:DUF721 domain-containing protein n=1 Tax=Thermodesulfatator indicus (strain DSM 15286 / JCM 11887 / CIR29812) TaxID=667014 RepID=F8ADQ4_THEID|nr:DUF721 domain-containing protein [Thermodesulfatator indicus]AEH46012.1 protein of unknown function DUF721 [Thermodesulfatator indicus DSM 15286]